MVGAYTLYNLILPSMEADIKLKYISVEYLDALLERVAKSVLQQEIRAGTSEYRHERCSRR